MISFKSILFALFLMSSNVYATVTSEVSTGGQIKSFDEKTVTLESRGYTFKVPRASIPKHYKIKTGEWVRAELQTNLMAVVPKTK